MFKRSEPAELEAGITEPIRKPVTETIREPMAATEVVEEVKQEEPSLDGDADVAAEAPSEEEHIKMRTSLPLQVPIGEMTTDKIKIQGRELAEEEKHEEGHAPAAEGGEAEGGEA